MNYTLWTFSLELLQDPPPPLSLAHCSWDIAPPCTLHPLLATFLMAHSITKDNINNKMSKSLIINPMTIETHQAIRVPLVSDN